MNVIPVFWIILKTGENNETEKIGLVTPKPSVSVLIIMGKWTPKSIQNNEILYKNKIFLYWAQSM